MLRNALVPLVRAVLLAATAFAIATGCSRQAEGERCDYHNAGDQDCDDGLVCTPCGNLQQKSIDRCCRPGGSYTDTRCIPNPNPSGEDCSHDNVGSGGSAGASTTGGTAGMSSGGMSSGGTSSAGTSSGGMSEMPTDMGGTTDTAGGAGSGG
ncbi:MAG TPA: hypothetical protein VGQ57_01105 [Polyangiaceae bacterium]|jgi:hypothetical protein|nr:hypothetical protein [Polyangiaceae bacterium]